MPIVFARSAICAACVSALGPRAAALLALQGTSWRNRDLEGLGLRITNHRLDEQLSLLERGELDLGVLVIDESAPMVENAVRDRGLAILNVAQAEAIARRLPRIRAGHICSRAVQIRCGVLPPTDKTVLQVDALVVGNGCASRSTTTGLLTLLARVFPDFLRRNKETPNNTGLPVAAAFQSFLEDGGPDLATQHVPWATDIMPLSNWIFAS